MTPSAGKKVYQALVEFTKEEQMFRIVRKDAYDSVPWARSAPCAVTMSALLEYAFDRADLVKERDIFSRHDKFGPTINVEYMLYRMGWDYWSLKDNKPTVGVGLLNDRATWHGIPNHSGHIYLVFGARQQIDSIQYDKDLLIGDNSVFNKPYRGSGYQVGTEGIWLPPGITPQPR
jgi:hypothetical protein